ncbi:MAG: hypothetical protein JSS83_04120 [Cyanobacteria bacterium SZAS LIN-3]|nr:hypothetical protein [Cyanobacteria bacterium SZAS LIN-3]MBS2008006.1 hypothetical protein [Cyanobacteria bacterium SZAS TMP-1]
MITIQKRPDFVLQAMLLSVLLVLFALMMLFLAATQSVGSNRRLIPANGLENLTIVQPQAAEARTITPAGNHP